MRLYLPHINSWTKFKNCSLCRIENNWIHLNQFRTINSYDQSLRTMVFHTFCQTCIITLGNLIYQFRYYNWRLFISLEDIKNEIDRHKHLSFDRFILVINEKKKNGIGKGRLESFKKNIADIPLIRLCLRLPILLFDITVIIVYENYRSDIFGLDTFFSSIISTEKKE